MVEYLDYLPLCLAVLKPTAAELERWLATPARPGARQNQIGSQALNRAFLEHLRLGSKDVLGGEAYRLLELRVDFDQAAILARLTNADIGRLAAFWPGVIYQYTSGQFERGCGLDRSASRYHATSFVAGNA
jgi:hypothetical protein